ncbi:MAG: GNAT family N-acetyltransferase [Acholeplasmatales bacterium]|nr:GNAT family N-acetyltransferase [Acholeplasmatales bacterium]
MQVFKVNDIKFKESLTKKILSELDEYFDLNMKNQIMANLSKDIYFTVQHNYGYQGFISLNENSETLTIDGIGISKVVTRQGCGKALIQASIDYAKINKKKLIIVKIKDDSSKDINYLKTRRFFTKMGFINLTVVNTNDFLNPCLIMAYIL